VIIGALLLTALAVMVVGRALEIGWPAGLPCRLVRDLWPVLRWIIAIGFTILAVEVLYYSLPMYDSASGLRFRVRFFPWWYGVFFLFCWDIFSPLGQFQPDLRNVGRFIAFMTWLYWTSFILLVGAELNAELAKESKKAACRLRELPQWNGGALPAGQRLIARLANSRISSALNCV